MKKKQPRKHKRASHRNATAGVSASDSRPRPRTRSTRSAPPDWKTIAAAVVGGASSAALGGLVVNQQILSPEAVGIGLMLGGGATAYFSEGRSRVVGTSIAAAGAGQFALAVMNKRAIKAHADATRTQQAAQKPVTQPPVAQLPPPPTVTPRESAVGGGYVVDLFRDAANDLDMVEDEWRYGIRDDADPDDEMDVIDLEEDAA